MESRNPPVGVVEIAARLGVSPAVVQQWRLGGGFPAPRWRVDGLEAWAWLDVCDWWEQQG